MVLRNSVISENSSSEHKCKWYVISTTVGCEEKVKRLIADEAQKRGVSNLIEELIVPIQSYPDVRRGKKVSITRKVLPGYVLIKMEPSDFMWNLVKNTQHVTKFLGSDKKPREVPDNDILMLLKRTSSEESTQAHEHSFDVGEIVKVIDGPFESMSAVIEYIDFEKKKLKVLVSIFGRESPLEVSFEQVEKISE